VLAWSLPLTLGYLVAIPFAVLTASQGLSEWLKRHALCGIPEEFDPPAEIRALQD
jgi:membrane glycosyltransferase